jgi:N-acetylneuraminate lyase
MSLDGLIAAVHTPIGPDGSLALGAVERQAEHLAAARVEGVFVGGTTGEAHSLTSRERMDLARRWAEIGPAHSLRVVVHVGHNCQPDACELARQAGQLGIDAIAAVAPSYFKPADTDSLLDFLAPVAAAAPTTPFYYYDIPSLSGVRLPTAELLERAPDRIATFAGLKYTNNDLPQYLDCHQRFGQRFTLLFGYDELLLAALALGAPGAVGSTYNFAAPLYRKVMRSLTASDLFSARHAQARANQFIRTLSRYGFLPATKAVMGFLGVDCGPVRPPLRPLTPAEAASLRDELETTGLLAECRSTS